jgi:hypothetical protein
MRSDKLQNAIGGIDPDLIARSEFPVKKKRGYKITSVIAAMLALAIGMGIRITDKDADGMIVFSESYNSEKTQSILEMLNKTGFIIMYR